jgi:hypothetical protein
MIQKVLDQHTHYRWFFTSKDVLVVGGKSDEQNELVLKLFSQPTFTLVHTSAPGSPFMILQSEKPSVKDIYEAAIYCACFSQEWKRGEKKISVDVFSGRDVYKEKQMKKGTFGVRGEKKKCMVTPRLYVVFQKGKLRAVPFSIAKDTIATITQGTMSKEKAADIIMKKCRDTLNVIITKEDVFSALPSGLMTIS